MNSKRKGKTFNLYFKIFHFTFKLKFIIQRAGLINVKITEIPLLFFC